MRLQDVLDVVIDILEDPKYDTLHKLSIKDDTEARHSIDYKDLTSGVERLNPVLIGKLKKAIRKEKNKNKKSKPHTPTYKEAKKHIYKWRKKKGTYNEYQKQYMREKRAKEKDPNYIPQKIEIDTAEADSKLKKAKIRKTKLRKLASERESSLLGKEWTVDDIQ